MVEVTVWPRPGGASLAIPGRVRVCRRRHVTSLGLMDSRPKIYQAGRNVYEPSAACTGSPRNPSSSMSTRLIAFCPSIARAEGHCHSGRALIFINLVQIEETNHEHDHKQRCTQIYFKDWGTEGRAADCVSSRLAAGVGTIGIPKCSFLLPRGIGSLAPRSARARGARAR